MRQPDRWHRRSGLARRVTIIVLITSTAVVAGVLPAHGDTATQTPGTPSITSVTAGDRQLTVNWSASSTPADRPVVDYQVMYRAGSSGAWSMASTYSVSYDSGVQDGSDSTWAHDRDPLDVGALSGGIATYMERTKGGRHNLDGIYRVKTDVAAVRVRVDGDASGAATIRGNYTTAPITDLRHNGTELGRVTQTAAQSDFQLAVVTPPLSSGSYIWIDGWDHTSTNTKFPEFAAVEVEDRRLRIDIATVSVATSVTISGLANQRGYQVRVRARNSAGWSAWSNISSGTPLGTPDAPADLWLESGNRQLIARWTAPANDGGHTISDYDIQYRADTPGASWTDWQASTISTATATTINTGLTNGVEYEVRVRAVNSAGDGPWTDAVADTAGKPSPPALTLSTIRRPRPTGDYDGGGLLSITLAAADNGSAVTDYDLRYRRSGTTTWYTYRDRSHDSGRLTTSEASGSADPIDFGTFASPSGGVAVTRESIGSGNTAKHGLYKFSKAVDQLWIRASGTITGGGTVAARWHTSKPTAANLATAGTQIFSAATESDHTFWQDGWVVDLPANAYLWLYTTDTETLTKRRLSLDFTDNATGGAMGSRDSGRLTTSEASGSADPIDFGVFTSPSGSVAVTREDIGTGANAKAGLYKFSEAVDRLWIRVSGTITDNAIVVARWGTSKPANLAAGNKIFSVALGSNLEFWHEGGAFNLPANAYLWLYTTGAETLSERRLQLDFTDGSAGSAMVLSGLHNGSTYELQARATNARGTGAWASASGTVGVPSRPDAEAPVAKHQALDVAWERPVSDNGSAVTGYDVRYRAGSSGAWTSWPHTTTARKTTITGLTNSTTYEVQVRAKNLRGNGFWSTGVKGTPAPQAPTAPEAPALTSSGTTMSVNWTAPPANGASITDYDIEYSSDSGTTWAPLLDTTFTSSKYTDTDYSDQATGNPIDLKQITGLPVTVTREQVGTHWGAYKVEGALGAIRVRVYGKTGQLDYVRARYGSTKPSANSNLHTQGTLLDEQLLSGSADFDISGTIDLPPVGTYFWVYTSTNTQITERTVQVSAPSISTATSGTISGLTGATTYQVRVRARNSAGTGPWSTASTHTIGRPSAPTAPTLTTGDAGLTAAWSAASGNGSAITDYDVQYCSSGCTSDANWTSLPDTAPSIQLNSTITGLTNGTTYQVRVRAENSVGAGPWSLATSVKVGLPGAPSAPTVSAGNATLAVNWAAPAGNGSAITDYDVRYCSANCDSSESAWQEHSPGANSIFTFATLRNLTNGTAYQIQVRADNQHGSGLWSPVVSAVPGIPAAPSAPTLVAGDHKIIVSWNEPADNGSAISDYDVRYCSANCGSESSWTAIADTVASTVPSALVSGLDVAKAYQVQVRAENSIGTGPWSASSTLTLTVSPVPDRTLRACDPAGLTQLWVDYACYIKAGERGIQPFDTVEVTGSGRDYVREHDYRPTLDLVEILAYNPNGGLARVETSLEGEVQDTFLIDVIRFGIRSHSVSDNLKAGEEFELTVRLHSPDHGSNSKYMRHSLDLARSSVKLSLPDQLTGYDHTRGFVDDPVQVVEQYGDSVTFRMLAATAGTYSISINAHRPDPDASCPSQGPLRCFEPPDGSETLSYLIAEPMMANATVGPPSPPATPSAVTVTRADGTLTATWPAVDGATSYHVTYSSNGGASWSLAAFDHPTSAITIDGADNAATYIVAVRARNSAGGSGWRNSAPAGPHTPSPPATPSAVTVARADGTLTATWPAVDGATSYHVTYSSNGGASWSLAAFDHPTSAITIDGADNAATYIVAVRARNSAGGSGWRNSAPAGPHTPSPPATPSAVTVTRADGTLTATWPAVDGATSYHVTYSSNGGASWSLAAFDHPTSAITIDGADNAATYIVAVRARNSAGGSGWRNSPPAGPHTPG